jgi:sugar O-acyltransferase (sialic acid O-acetyltransferase NeuD family)
MRKIAKEQHKGESLELNEDTRLVILGTDADARTALDIANIHQLMVFGFMTDNAEEINKEINDISVIMRVDSVEGKKFLDDEEVAVAIGERDITKRKDLARKVHSRKVEIVNLCHPSVSISPFATIGLGNLIAANTVIGANSHLGSYNSIQANTVIDADITMGSFCTLQSGVQIGRGVQMDSEIFIGAGAIVFAGMKIGKGAFIAPGAVVLHSVSEGVKVAGNPAKAVGNA